MVKRRVETARGDKRRDRVSQGIEGRYRTFVAGEPYGATLPG